MLSVGFQRGGGVSLCFVLPRLGDFYLALLYGAIDYCGSLVDFSSPWLLSARDVRMNAWVGVNAPLRKYAFSDIKYPFCDTVFVLSVTPLFYTLNARMWN